MTQLSFELIPHTVEGALINQRASDGYMNATAMCQSVGKQFNDYFRLKTTQEFLTELSSETGIPVLGLMQIFRGGSPQNRGTWVHPDIAVNLAQWLSPKFAVQVSKWVREWLSGGTAVTSELPHHLKRYMANRGKIPHTHFSVLNELAFNLIAPLEQAGYTLPDDMVPDISQGRIFSDWLRKERDIEPKDFPSYDHEYPDGRIFPARLYPNQYLADFREHFNVVCLPKHAPKYFKDRDKEALKLISAILLPEKTI